MPHPLHNFKIKGKMNLYSLQSLFKNCLSIGLMCLSFLILSQEHSIAQSIIQKDTINVVIPSNSNKGVITGQQLHDELNPSGLLCFDNIDSISTVPGIDIIYRDTTFIPDDNTPIFYVSCDTFSTYKNDSPPDSSYYGVETTLDTLANLSEVTFFSYFDGPTRRNQQMRSGSNSRIMDPPLSGSGTSITTFLRVIDNTAPVAICKGGTTSDPTLVQLDSLGMITAMQLDSLSSDNCTPSSELIFTIDPDTIHCDSFGVTFPITLMVTDAAGNTGTCVDTVRVEDIQGPIIQNVPADDTLTCTDAIPAQMVLTATDNCSAIPMDSIRMFADTLRPDTSSMVSMDSLLRDSAFYNYDVVYKWVATDTLGNVGDTATQVIRVRDTAPPVINFDTLLLVQTSANSTTCSGDTTLNLLANIKDLCSDTLKRIAVASQDTVIRHDTLEIISLNIPMGDTTIFIIAQDFSNNIDTHKIEIRVDDRTEPVPRCNNSVAVTINAFGFAAIDSSVINLNSIDNCTSPGDLRFELSRDTFRCPDIGKTITIFMNVIDKAGNSAPCQSNVTVNDFAGTGSFACPADVTIACDASIDPDSTGFPTLMDVCGGGSGLAMSDKIIAGPGGTGNICQIIERTWTFTDSVSGTVTTCLQKINLVDAIAPVLTESFNDTIVACIMDADTRDSILATDNCVDNAYVHAVDSFTMGMDTITLRRIWTAFDSCTITADTQYIKIIDDIAPLVNLPADTIFNTGDFNPDSCGVFVNIDFTPYITDCNASLGLRLGYQVQDSLAQDTTAILAQYFPIGEYSVIVTARDSSNNIGRDTIMIDVNDTSIPTVVCVENIVVSLGSGGTGVLEVADVLIRASDNCGATLPDSLAALSQSVFDCSDLGSKPITLTVTDTSGNVGMCLVNVSVVNQGNTNFISIETDSIDESLTGLSDGQAWVTVTGGSGNYTVQWNDPANSTTDTITNLAPGLYMVTVDDATNGCRLTDTIRVNAGSTVSYVIGDVSGAPGTVVQVPVTVTNFRNVTSIDMALITSNPMVGQFIPNNPAGGFNVNIDVNEIIIDTNDPNRLRIVPQLTNANGETVADGTAIFYINIQIPATATIGSTTMITAAGDEVADIKTGLIINGMAMDLTSTSTAGTITVIDPGIGVINVGGKINLINGDPLFDATVMVSGDVSSEDSTKADGTYSVMVNEGQSITITPTENENARNGLSTFDLVLIQDHINGRLLDSPYKRLAADINKSGSITIFDIIEIQDVILRRLTSFTTVPSWTFVPADHTFTNQANPWGGTVPTSITTTASAADSALNFIAIKTGDVSLDADEVRFQGNVAATDRNKDFAFKITDQLVEAGTYVEIPFRADNFEEMRGYQMTLDVATDWLTFEAVKPGALTDVTTNNFSLTNIAKGQIATNWFNNAAKTVDADETLFTLVFKVEKTGKQLSDLLQITSDMIQAEAYTDELFYNGIDLVFEDHPAVAGTYELFQNKPNPFRNETTVSFNLPEKAPVTLRFFDFSGRLAHQVKGDFVQGMNNITISKNELATNGVLYYELSTPGFTARKKMIVLE